MKEFNITDKSANSESRFVLIAGPCVAESMELCIEVAEKMQQITSALNITYVFKASFDKANRSSVNSPRGPGLKQGLSYLDAVKQKLNLPVVTDIHETAQVKEVSEIADILQIPAYLCRQTDLLVAAGNTGKTVNIKKGQFMAPEDMLYQVVVIIQSDIGI